MSATQSRINDFVLKIATVNGTGSASANGLIMQAIFRMGIPVSGKNVFPSNIQGLPTWYEIRVNKHGYTARTPHFDLMVALNAATYAKDVAEVRERPDAREAVAGPLPLARTLLGKRRTDNTEAYQLCLEGRLFWEKRTAGAVEKAIRCFI